MRKWMVYLAVFVFAAATDAMGFRGTDVGKLLPVEAVRLSTEAGQIILETDTGNKGAGEDVEAALQSLKETAEGDVFLETADYLILQSGCERYLPEFCSILRPSCGLCLEMQKTDPQKATAYLAVHGTQITLRDWIGGAGKIPMLAEKEGRMYLVQ